MSKILGKDTLPNQKLSFKDKAKNDFQWAKDTIDYYIGLATFDTNGKISYDEIRRQANGELDESDYETFLKPYKNKVLTNYKGALRNVDITSPLLDLISGEKDNAPFEYFIKVNNEDSYNRMTAQMEEAVMANIEQNALNALNAAGVETGTEPQEVPSPNEFVNNFKRDWSDDRAIAGQEVLDNLVENLDLKSLYTRVFEEDWLQLGEAYTVKHIFNDDVVLEQVKPEDIWVDYSPLSPFAEDGYAYTRRSRLGLADIVEKFEEELSTKYVGGKKKDESSSTRRMLAIDWILDLLGNPSADRPRNSPLASEKDIYDEFTSSSWYHRGDWRNGRIEIYEVGWISLDEYKIRRYYDEFGIIREEEVDVSYKKTPDDISVQVIYYNNVWKGFKIGGDDEYAIYLGIEPHPVQRQKINVKSGVKLPINGRKDGTSIVSRISDFQKMYNIVSLMEERTLAKNKDKPLLFPIGLIPDIPEWGKTAGERTENFLYYRDVLGIMFFDETKNNAPAIASAMKAVDMSTIDTIVSFIKLKEQIKIDAWDSIGMNRQRYGDTFASEGKSTQEQAIFRSSVITSRIFSKYSKMEEKDLEGCLDYSKVAYIDGKTITKFPTKDDFMISERTRSVFALDPQQHAETEYGVSVKSSKEVSDDIRAIKSMALPFAQNKVGADAIAKLLTEKSPVKATDYLRQALDLQRQYEENLQRQAQESQEKIAQAQQQTEQAKIDWEKEKHFTQLASDKEIAIIKESDGATTNTTSSQKTDNPRVKANQQRMQEQQAASSRNKGLEDRFQKERQNRRQANNNKIKSQ